MKKITLQDYLTASGKYPERAAMASAEVIANAEELLRRINAALEYVGWRSPEVTSGFRPSSVNATVAGAAKKSNHMSGLAIDILDDKNQSLCKVMTREILEKFDLYREDSDATIGKNQNWCHLQTKKTASGKRVFKP